MIRITLHYKRMLASLLLVVVLSGVLSPLSVSATNTESTTNESVGPESPLSIGTIWKINTGTNLLPAALLQYFEMYSLTETSSLYDSECTYNTENSGAFQLEMNGGNHQPQNLPVFPLNNSFLPIYVDVLNVTADTSIPYSDKNLIPVSVGPIHNNMLLASGWGNEMQWRGTDGSVAHNYNYNTFFHNFGTGTESANAWTFYLQRINEMTKAMETPTSFEAEDVLALLRQALGGEYLAANGTDTLNEYTLEYYFALGTLGLMHPARFGSEAKTASEQVHAPLSMSSVFNNLKSGTNTKFDFSYNIDKVKGQLVDNPEFVYSAKRLGALGLDWEWRGSSLSGAPSEADVSAKILLFNCIAAYYEYFIEGGLKRYGPENTENVDYTAPDFMTRMNLAHDIDAAFGDFYPWVHEMYTWKDNTYTQSLEDLYNEKGDTNTKGNEGLKDLTQYSSELQLANIGDGSPMDKFYSIRGNSKIITEINFDAVVSDITPSSVMDEILKTVMAVIQQGFGSVENPDSPEDELTREDAHKLLTDKSTEAITTIVAMTNDRAEEGDPDITTTVSSRATDVYMSANILTGMRYSASYIPMRTNVYDTNLIDSYDDQKWRREFFSKYGYLRKALYIDTNGSAAVNYYNTSGTSIGVTRLATLRDLLYNEMGNDVVLYIDDGFYNSNEITDKVPSLLNSHATKYDNLLEDLGAISETYTALHQKEVDEVVKLLSLFGLISGLFTDWDGDDDIVEMTESEFWNSAIESVKERYNFVITSSDRYKKNIRELNDLAVDIEAAGVYDGSLPIDDSMLKSGEYRQYNTDVMSYLSKLPNSAYVDLQDTSNITMDNYDSVVLPSSQIKDYLEPAKTYIEQLMDKKKNNLTETEYETSGDYTSMAAFAFVSYLYRDPRHFTLANLVATNTPVFIASDDLCNVASTEGSCSGNNQWYRNSLLNYMLLQNLKANVQIDYTFCIDLDCPIYMDIFGNILTESGIVVIPAASNATLHTAKFKDYNIAFGLYNVYGKEYKVPISMENAYSVLFPYFTPDLNSGYYEISNIQVKANNSVVHLAALSNYSSDTATAVQDIYARNAKDGRGFSQLNYPAMVNIIHETLRGSYLENISKDREGLTYAGRGTRGALVAAAKYEGMLDSFNSSSLNSLLAIPDFTKMDGVDYWVALAIKLMIVATVAVCIVSIYRDSVANMFGLHTLKTIISSVFLTVACIVVIPNVFNITYYAANKFLLEDDAFRILLINEEKRQCGVEIKMTSVETPDVANDDFSIRLESVTVPWYKQMKTVIFGDVSQPMSQVREEAFGAVPITENNDVTIMGDGVYVTTSTLFDSVGIDYLWKGDQYGRHGLYLWNTNSDQTAGYYSPYYAFLKVLTANVNSFNSTAANGQPAYSYTSKYVSGNRLKTCGLCYNYFLSPEFMGEDAAQTDDIMQLRSIYYNADKFINYKEGEIFENTMDESENSIRMAIDPTFRQAYAAAQNKEIVNMSSRYFNVFSEDDLNSFGYCAWYNVRTLPDLEHRIGVMDTYARSFIADNADLLTKVTDETFLKCMALYMSVKYNQVFGVDAANSLELYNLDSTDIIRLSSESAGNVALSVSMSYPRFVYNYGGEASVYAASFLSMILWIGSFIKPIATLLIFVIVVVSVWVFRIILQRPSANVWGYFCTVVFLCLTNLFHALLLKVGLLLPEIGLPMVGCLLFMCVGQVIYLLILSYIVGISLKDWSNLGFNEYQKEAMHLRAKFNSNSLDYDHLNGAIPHHENNWDYYNELVDQHRSRNSNRAIGQSANELLDASKQSIPKPSRFGKWK